ASGVAYQQGRGVRKDGGILLSGEWNFSSGTDHSDWSMLACMVREDDKVIDYWHVLGMKATNSKTVKCKDVYVPAHRVCSMFVAKPGHAWPGLEIHRN